MKSYLLILASLMIANGSAAEPAFPNRPWKADTPGLILLQDANYDNATATIETTASGKAIIPLILDTRPNVGAHSYALLGEVKFEGVGGTGFLETWTTVGGKKAFSRTLGEYGPMAKLTGNSTWREFMLPMNLMGVTQEVTQIEMNVVMPDGGKVWLRKLRLEPMDFETAAPNRQIMIGVGALVLAVVGLLVWRSRRRQSSEAEIKRMMAADV